MAKLIDADFLVESFCREKAVLLTDTRLSKSQRTELKKLTQLVIDVLNAAPTVDPVRHGRWAKDKWLIPRCSSCRSRPYLDGSEEYAMTRYCPHCGAKMDGDNNA